MDYIWSSINTVAVIGILIAVGYVFSHVTKATEEQYAFAGKLTVNVCIPCLVFNQMMTGFMPAYIVQDWLYILIIAGITVALIVLSHYLGKGLKLTKEHLGLFVVLCTMPNSMLLGRTINVGIFGDEAMRYVIYSYFISTISFWTYGRYVIDKAAGKPGKFISKDTLLQIAKTPSLIAFFGAMVLLLLGVKIPQVISDAAYSFEKMATPLGMVYIGMTLYRFGIKLRLDRSVIFVNLVRFIVTPVLALLLMKPFDVPYMVKAVLTLQLSMPVMTQASIVTGLAGGDAGYMARNTVISTILCLPVTPLITMLARVL